MTKSLAKVGMIVITLLSAATAAPAEAYKPYSIEMKKAEGPVAVEAPSAWWSLSSVEQGAFYAKANCGPAASDLRLNYVLGVDVRYACTIHDFMYYTGGTEYDRRVADLVFKRNLDRVLHSKHDMSESVRASIGRLYYVMCRGFGWLFFWYR
jgi:hypothetical protein